MADVKDILGVPRSGAVKQETKKVTYILFARKAVGENTYSKPIVLGKAFNCQSR